MPGRLSRLRPQARQSDGWSEEVIERRSTFVANDIEAIAEVFDDHELIRSLGCEIVINIPVVDRRRGARHDQLPARARVSTRRRENRGGRGARNCRRPRASCSTNAASEKEPSDGGQDDSRRDRRRRHFHRPRLFRDRPRDRPVAHRHGQGRHDAARTSRRACSTSSKRAASIRRAIDFLAHGTTVVINALTERKGVKVGLITTEGFRDTLEIARGNRPDFFNLHYQKPKPFVPRYLRRELPGRMTYKGEEMRPLDLSGLPAILDDFKADGVEAIAICFLHSYANPSHERAALARSAQALARRLGRLLAPDHPRVARVRAHPIPLCSPPMCSRLPSATSRRLDTGPQGDRASRSSPTSCSRTAASTRWHRSRKHSDHHGGIRPRLRLLGRGGTRQADRRAQRAGARHRRHDRQMLADRERRGEDQDRLLDRARPHLGRLSDHGSGGRSRRDRQRRRLDRLGRRFRQAACRAAIRRRGSRPGGLWPRRRQGDHDRRQSLARPHQQGLFLRRRDRRRHGGG